ncbi:MAG TPA: hypothetical protein VGH82_07600 [Gaiellaceae bacterium]|jgi:uncharacterized protein YjiS (DUF1127 family)
MRFRRAPAPDAAAPPPTARAVRRALPPAGQLRRERRNLLVVRERKLRDLGGLMLEMYRRDQFRQDLLVDRCGELGQIEERLAELDALLAAVISRGKTRPSAHCECGAPIFWGAKFCGQCGRPVAESPALRVES